MSRAIRVGSRFDAMPIPLVEANTTYFKAGVVDIGVEYRFLTDDILEAAIPADVRAEKGIDASRPPEPLDEQGVSLHVCDAANHDEYLRFDAFQGDPHYHYIVPGSHNVVIGFDEVAGGDFLTWMYTRLSTRLPEMLREAGADELAAKVDPGALEAALPAVREKVDQARRANG